MSIGVVASSAVQGETRFQLVVDTTKAGSASDHFVFPGSTYNNTASDYTIDWGDTTTTTVTKATEGSTDPSDHGYSAPGTYVISVTANTPTGFSGPQFGGGGDCLKVTELKNWGTFRWNDGNSAFSGCANMVITAEDHDTANTGSVWQFNSMFSGCSSMTAMPAIDVINARTVASMFYHCSALVSIAFKNASSATYLNNMGSFCEGCGSLTTLPDDLDTADVTDFSYAFYSCTSLAYFPAWDTGKATAVNFMFANDSGLDGFDFPTLNFRKITNGAYCLYGFSISPDSYSALIIDMANSIVTGVQFHGGGAQYTEGAAATAHDHLTTATGSGGLGWTITDGGLYYGTDQIGTMSGYTNTAGTISADSEYSATYAAWKAADRAAGSGGWYPTGANTGWLMFVFDEAKTCDQYWISNDNDHAGQQARAWTLQGSNNGTDWTDLDTVSRGAWGTNEIARYDIDSPASYTHYRVNITAGGGGGSCGVGELYLVIY